MSEIIKIGTRNSQLALWQANLVKDSLDKLGYNTEIVEISSTGDEVLDKPLHLIGGMGLFTKTLDIAMLKGDIDIAVHSLKDVPTDLEKGISQAAVLQRADVKDVLIYKGEFNEENIKTIATGSLRRKAQWLNRYPNDNIVGLRGNVNTRLRKLEENDWAGAIFAKAGLERINLLPENKIVLDWMTPAPAQGAIMITCLESNTYSLEASAKLNHKNTEMEVHVERQFMKTLEGGCTAPIGALAIINGDEMSFKGMHTSIDGTQNIEVEIETSTKYFDELGQDMALELLDDGGKDLMIEIKQEMKK